MKIAVSACLLGYNCRYDGTNNFCKKVYDLKDEFELVPICPEIYGDLSTPRSPSEITNYKQLKVYNKDEIDVTDNFKKGAQMAYDIINIKGIKIAILKQKSPSCGKGLIYDGTFSKNLVEGNGVACDLFLEKGIKVYSEDDDLREIK